MKILLLSHVFAPSVGGIETMSRVLAEEFERLGHEVRVVTQTPGVDGSTPYCVIRRPKARDLLSLVRWSDIFYQNNVSLQTIWPLALVRRPWVVTHQTWVRQTDGSIGHQERIKRLLLKRAHGIAISTAIARDTPGKHTIIGNCYDSACFHSGKPTLRDQEFLFVGRLVSDKGADMAIEALSRMSSQFTLTIVGQGPEREHLEKQACRLGLESRITFPGALAGEALADCMRQHRVLLVPSRWHEPFGIVALEGAGCGCTVVGSSGGGLADAIGPCGLTFRNGDVNELAAQMEAALALEIDEEARQHHLHSHHAAEVAKQYVKVFEKALQ